VDNTPADAPAPAAPSSTPKSSTSAPALPPHTPINPPKTSEFTKSVPVPIKSRILASPLAKRLATEKRLDLSVRITKYNRQSRTSIVFYLFNYFISYYIIILYTIQYV